MYSQLVDLVTSLEERKSLKCVSFACCGLSVLQFHYIPSCQVLEREAAMQVQQKIMMAGLKLSLNKVTTTTL